MSNTNHDTREIDLLELFSSIGKGLKNAFLAIIKSILFLIVFGIKKAHWLALITISGALIGYLIYLGTDRYYTSSLIAQPNGISSVDMLAYINDLNRFTEKKNYIALSNALNLPDTICKKIKKIAAFYYIDFNKDGRGDIIDFENKYEPSDTNQQLVMNRFYLEVSVFDNKIFSFVKEGLFNYIEGNPYVIKLNNIRKDELQQLILQSDREIAKLDSLQNVDYFKNNINRLASQNDNRLMFLSEKDKQMFYRDKLNLIQQKLKYSKELELSTTPITVIKDFAQLTIEENPLVRYILWSGFIFLIMGYCILLYVKHKSIFA